MWNSTQETAELARKLAASAHTLAGLTPPETGVTPREAVYCDDKATLYRYTPRVPKPAAVPVLIVYALVNRPYMMDLQEDRSTIRGLLDQGLDVYLIEWGYPDRADRWLELDDYINGYIRGCVRHICEAHGLPRINLLGVCQGGAFATCYTALHPGTVANLVTMVTPIDFKTPGNLLSQWAQGLDVDTLVDALGNVPGELLNFSFLTMKPLRLTGQKYLDMLNLLDDAKALKNFLRMEKWIFDSPDQAGEAYRQFIKWFYQENRLVRGDLEIGGRPVRLSAITQPVFNVYATEDHLVPPAASLALGKLVKSRDYSEYAFKGGHIGIYVSGRAQKDVPPAIAQWLKARMK
jgi:polyhydroxyalkanoate synthase